MSILTNSPNQSSAYMPSVDVGDALRAFRAAMAVRGLLPPAELIADGRMHRCPVEGKRSRDDTGTPGRV